MAQTIFVPTPGIPPVSLTQDKGATLFDPVSKSSLTKPVAFCETNACGAVAYKKFSTNFSASVLINCVPTSWGSLSLSGFIPATGDAAAQVDFLLNDTTPALLAQLIAALTALDCA